MALATMMRSASLHRIVVGILILWVSTSSADTAELDSRPAKLQAFFHAYGCPEPLHIQDYLNAADANKLDYRLLPALSVRESTCGIHARLNNRWGWNSAKTGFQSVSAGIHYLAHVLSHGQYYRGKNVEQKIYVYNPLQPYVREVTKLMREIDEEVDEEEIDTE